MIRARARVSVPCGRAAADVTASGLVAVVHVPADGWVIGDACRARAADAMATTASTGRRSDAARWGREAAFPRRAAITFERPTAAGSRAASSSRRPSDRADLRDSDVDRREGATTAAGPGAKIQANVLIVALASSSIELDHVELLAFGGGVRRAYTHATGTGISQPCRVQISGTVN